MSLINQMLKDIDKRQGHSTPPGSNMSLAMTRSRSGVSGMTWGLVGLVLVAGLGLAVYGWMGDATQQPASAPAAPLEVVQAEAPKLEAAPEEKPVVTPEPVKAELVKPAPVKAETVVGGAAQPQPQDAKTVMVRKDAVSLKKNTVVPEEKVVPKPPKESAQAVEMSAQAVVQGSVTRVLSAGQRAENAYREAATLVRQGRVQEAQKNLQQALVDQPAHLQARLMYARLLQSDGRIPQAQVVLSEGVQLLPQAFPLYAALAQMQLMGRQHEQAVATLERGLPAAGNDAAYHALLATALQQQARHADAIDHYVIALRQQPDSSNWLVGLGISLQAQGNKQGAAEAYERAIELGLPAALSQFANERLRQVVR
jgi:MSHA biogenesis protein MshN